MTVLWTSFFDSLPNVCGVQRQLIEDDSGLSEVRFETFIPERFAFIQQQDRGSRRRQCKEAANHASTKSTCSKDKGRKGNSDTKQKTKIGPPSVSANNEESVDEQDVITCGKCDRRGHLKVNCP